MNKPFNFKPNPVAKAVVAFASMMAATTITHAGPGFGDAYDLNNSPFIIQSYFANSPAGQRLWVQIDGNGDLVLDALGNPIPDPLHGAPLAYDPANRKAFAAAVAAKYPNGYPGTGQALRKFVDPLPLPRLATDSGSVPTLADGTTPKYIPVAVASKWRNPQGVSTNDDYYEIAVVEYKEKFHSDLANPTTLRGYVQIDHEASNGRAPLPGSKSFALTYPDGSAIMINGTNANGKLTGAKVAALAVDAPHYLGPVIAATSTNAASVAAGLPGAPTRIKFLNLLPVGRAQTTTDAGGNLTVAVDGNGNPLRKGDIFLPLDPSVAGSGYGSDGAHTYSQNRALIHLHGGDNPWISDGTPHQWITPIGEADPSVPGSIASLNAEPAAGPLDPSLLPEFLRGVGAINVPDMNDPGPGAMTYYFPNGQSARMEWYHDHSVGMTRLNVYAGMASAYLLTDAAEQDLIARGVLPGADATIPLVLQEKTFVPNDIALQDARWDTRAWGAAGDLWYPHVYETVQDPNQATNFNAVGRWHWGPWFWPSFPSLYNLPSGAYGDVTLTPEAWMDTPVINGVAYPTLEVEAKPYRFRILNASNDRTFTFNLFKADDAVTGPAGKTEVKMIPVTTWQNLCAAGVTKSDGVCTPETWTTDVYGHAGGVPDPTTQGPTLYQVASEGGFLPGVAKKDATPISYLLDKGRAAVLNTDFANSGLHLGNGERADVVVDFSAYAPGTTFIVYNDAGAPVPAADPRNEYFTGYGDNSATGGAEDTLPGYGPNTRTMMRIVVKAPTVAAVPVDPATLDTGLKAAYAASQDRPVVAQSAYNGALGTSWTDTKAFAHIYTGSLKEPSFNFVPGTAGAAFNSVLVTNQGSGYITPPNVTLSGGGGTGATAKASLKIDKIHVVNPGSGYKVAPLVTITSLGAGSGATATPSLGVLSVQVNTAGAGYSLGSVSSISFSGGSGYITTAVSGVVITNGGRYNTNNVTATFSAPPAGGTRATGTVIMTGSGNNRRVAGVNITNPGSGYGATATVTFSNGTTRATGTVNLGSIAIAPTVSFPTPAGGTAATATATVDSTGAVTGVTLVNAGRGYDTAPTPTISGLAGAIPPVITTTVTPLPTLVFAKPLGRHPVQATGVPILSATGAITGVTLTNPGSGYTIAPSVTVSGTSATAAKLTSVAGVAEVLLDIPDPTNPNGFGGGGYTDLTTAASDPNNAAPGMTITFTAPPAGGVAATAGATGRVFDITLTNAGTGYTGAPGVAVTAPTRLPVLDALAPTMRPVRTTAAANVDTLGGGTPTGSILVKTKAIQELFDPTYGRLNATFGVEIPYTSALTQTTIPLGYVDAPTEEFADGETQIWKITHNGVDTHPIHFHLMNVQLINRVGWDNFITPPEPNELGWKETIKMSPLEDVIVAVRAKKPALRQSSTDGSFRDGAGFGLPNSVRLLDPAQPEGAMTGFTQIDPNTGMPAPMANVMQDFGWEYVWHCHILGHEENDFMRPVIFHANEAVPATPSGLAYDTATGLLTWSDAADTEFKYTVDVSTSSNGAFVPMATLPANSTQQGLALQPAESLYRYRVTATGQNGSSNSVLSVNTYTPPAAPTGLVAAPRPANGNVSLSWIDNASNETSYAVQRRVTGTSTWSTIATLAANVQSYTNTNASATAAYDYQVVAVNLGGSVVSNIASVPALAVPAAATLNTPTAARSGGNSDTVTLTWTAPAGGGAIANYTIQRCTGATCTNFANVTTNVAGTATTYANTGLARNTTYRYRMFAVNAAGSGAVSNVVNIVTP